MLSLLLTEYGAVNLEHWLVYLMVAVEIVTCFSLILRLICTSFIASIKDETKFKKFLIKAVYILNIILGAFKIIKEKGADYGRNDTNGTSTSNSAEQGTTSENDGIRNETKSK